MAITTNRNRMTTSNNNTMISTQTKIKGKGTLVGCHMRGCSCVHIPVGIRRIESKSVKHSCNISRSIGKACWTCWTCCHIGVCWSGPKNTRGGLMSLRKIGPIPLSSRIRARRNTPLHPLPLPWQLLLRPSTGLTDGWHDAATVGAPAATTAGPATTTGIF